MRVTWRILLVASRAATLYRGTANAGKIAAGETASGPKVV
jgi:hypothetical protein